VRTSNLIREIFLLQESREAQLEWMSCIFSASSYCSSELAAGTGCDILTVMK
jgi:hypothetical protein